MAGSRAFSPSLLHSPDCSEVSFPPELFLQSLLVKQILHLPRYQVEFGAVLLPLQVSQQWVCNSLQGSKTSCKGGAGRGSTASCQEGCAAPGMAEWGSHELIGRMDAWRLKEKEGRGRKGRNRKRCRKIGLKKIRCYLTTRMHFCPVS